MNILVLVVAAVWKIVTFIFLAAVVLVALVFFADTNTNYPIKWCAFQIIYEGNVPPVCTDIPRY